MNQPAHLRFDRRRHALFLIAFFSGAVLSAPAQFTSALQGTVQDNAGATVSSATVTLTNVENKVSQTATVNGSGVYRFSGLAPGNYQIVVSAGGFSSTKTSFTLNTAETRDVPIALSVGGVSTQVEVTEQQPLLDTSDSRNQLTLNTAAFEGLPLAAVTLSR